MLVGVAKAAKKPPSPQGRLRPQQCLRVVLLLGESVQATLVRNSCSVATMSLRPKTPTNTPANLPSRAVWRA